MWRWLRRLLHGAPPPVAKVTTGGELRPSGRFTLVRFSKEEVTGVHENVAAIVRAGPVATAMRTADSAGVGSGADLTADGGVEVTRTGRLSQGEASVPRVGEILREALRRDGLTVADIEDLSRRGARAEDGVDLRFHLAGGGVLGAQVTRAVGDHEIGRITATTGHATKRYTATELVDMLRAAVAKKSPGSSASRARVVLALEATEVLVSLSDAAVTQFMTEHRQWIRTLGWHSVWLVGPSVNFTRRLDD